VGKITKVVIDTNVFISGFGWDGKPEAVLQLVEIGSIANFITSGTFEELKRVISYPKLKFSSSLQTKILEFAFSYSQFVNSGRTVSLIKEDPDDNRFIECALSAHAAFIISGDPHLLKLGEFEGIRIVGPAEFLEMVEK